MMMEFALDHLVLRLPKEEHKRSEFEQQLRNLRAGAAGEKKVFETIRSIALPEHCEVIDNISLPLMGGIQFQIDLAVISLSGILLIETKQIAGRLRFHTHPADLIKVDEDGRFLTSYDCPVAQLKDQQENLTQWLTLMGFRVPVSGAVVFANNPIIEQIPQNMPVFKLREARGLVRRHIEKQNVISDYDVRVIAMTLQRYSIPYLPFPFSEKRNFNSSVVNKKPICSLCGTMLRKPTERIWECPVCEMVDGKPYAVTLLAWFLLIKKMITAKEIMSLFQLKTNRAAQNAISGLPVKKIGATRSMAYQVDYAELANSEIVRRIIENWLERREAKQKYERLYSVDERP